MLASRIRRMGNSWGIIIPKAYLEALGLHERSKVQLEMEDGTLTLSPIHEKDSLEKLVARMTPDNTHPEVSTGHAVGDEIIED